MSRKKGFKVKRSRRNLYKKRKSIAPRNIGQQFAGEHFG